jgi:hypothetical protein
VKPKYTHDCDKCVFLGTYDDDGIPKDLYYCATGGLGGPTIVSRFSSEGPDYISGIHFADSGSVPSLVEAKRRAVERGLMS